MTIQEAIKLGQWTKCIVKDDGTKICSHEKNFEQELDLFNKSDKITRNWRIVYEQK